MSHTSRRDLKSRLSLRTILANAELFRPFFETRRSTFNPDNGGLLCVILNLDGPDLVKAMMAFKPDLRPPIPSNQEMRRFRNFITAAYEICDHLEAISLFDYGLEDRDPVRSRRQISPPIMRQNRPVEANAPTTSRLATGNPPRQSGSPPPPYSSLQRAYKRTRVVQPESDSDDFEDEI